VRPWQRSAGADLQDIAMRAVTVEPGTAGSAQLEDVPEPAPQFGPVRVEVLAVGVGVTDDDRAGGPTGGPHPANDG
jgi:glucose 1-dehydrogenase